MKKLVLSFAMVLALAISFTSCRETKEKSVETTEAAEGSLEKAGKAADDAVEAGKALDKAVKEIDNNN
jgi:Tfp pilus assembly protein PilF